MSLDNRLQVPLDGLLDQVPDDWRPITEFWRHSPAGRGLTAFVEARRRAGAVIYPAAVLQALTLTRRGAVRVVILGQDPYHGPGQAEGLAFSVPPGVKAPPSLRNMLAELARDLGVQRAQNGHLAGWSRQGVLLLNTVFTVEQGRPASHARQGWEALSDALIAATAADDGDKVYLLWGAHAQAKAALVNAAVGRRHRVLMANHPSPLSARRPPVPFLGCGHFGLAQAHLAERHGPLGPIDWSL